MNPITIIGGGLAGLSLGVALQKRGIPTTLHEAGCYPRHRVCGEFLNGVGDETLGHLGILDLFADAHINEQARWYLRGKTLREDGLPVAVRGISRYTIDQRLADRFVELGGNLKENSRVTGEVQPGTIQTCGRRRTTNGKWLGLSCHLQNASLPADLEMHLGKEGYVGLSKIENGRVNLCGLFRERDIGPASRIDRIPRYLEENGLTQLAEFVRSSNPDPNSVIGVNAFRIGWQKRSNAGNNLALGDCLGIIPPFTGNGMSMALESAALAIDPIVQFSRGKLSWSNCVELCSQQLQHSFRKRMRLAQSIHPLLLHRPGQEALRLASQTGLLPFRLLFRQLR